MIPNCFDNSHYYYGDFKSCICGLTRKKEFGINDVLAKLYKKIHDLQLENQRIKEENLVLRRK